MHNISTAENGVLSGMIPVIHRFHTVYYDNEMSYISIKPSAVFDERG